jgi:hypothetical protein
MFERLAKNWVYGGFLAGILLLVLAPLLLRGWSAALVATFLCLPAYMIHQLEEHDADRFRTFVNTKIGRGADVLTTRTVFIVNIPGVWGVIAVSIWLAATVHVGLGLIAAYLLLVNAVVHCGPAVGLRSYNPGLVTAIVLFFPVGGYAVYTVQEAGAGTLAMHLVGFATAVLIHAVLIAHVLRNKRMMQRAQIAVR